MASSIVISQQNSLVLDFSQPLDLESANSSLSIGNEGFLYICKLYIAREESMYLFLRAK